MGYGYINSVVMSHMLSVSYGFSLIASSGISADVTV